MKKTNLREDYVFKQEAESLLKQMNKFVNMIWESGEYKKLGSTLRKDDGCLGFNGLFRDEGFVGMIEANDMKNWDSVSKCLRSIRT